MKRVLFVDDDSAVLDGLRVRLHVLRKRWELVFVESGARAVTEIEQGPFDAIVTDMRMPSMDGAQLLEIVAKRWPETIRIVLSGYAEDEQTARLLTIAHQYLSKPCDPQLLEKVIERCLALHELLTEPRLRSIVGRIRQLPALPRTYSRLRDLMSKPESGIGEVAAVITADTAIAAKVLQIVNSAFFRRARAITKIESAVSHLGFAAIRNIALSVEVFSQWSGNQMLPGFDPERLQQQGQQVAAIAHALAAGTPLADDAMLAGLMHNIGYWVMVKECPKELQQAREFAREHKIAMYEAEREIIGASYAEVGAYLLGIWGLPQPVIEAVAFQRRSELVMHTGFDVLSALVVAESLAFAGKPDAFGMPQAPPRVIDDAYLRLLNAPFDGQEARRRAEAVMGEEQT